ncbi:MAG: hypothetical protein ABI809_05275 [Caldimonas sp.]
MNHAADFRPNAFVRAVSRREGASRMRTRALCGAAPREPAAGPGWFDSSWDLQSGLDVLEGLPEDAKLNEWIEVCLRS